MKRVLVLGASGGMGSALVFELASRNIEVVAFARNKKKLDELFGSNGLIEVRAGDVFTKEDLRKAASGVDVIFHSVNIPYPEWSEKQPALLTNILEVAKETKSRLAIVDNIYAYGRSNGKLVSEQHPKKPHTKKGRIRLQLETMARASEIPILIAHFPDFYGPNTPNALLNYTFQALVQNKKAMFVGNQTIAREFIYTPDGAKAMVDLAFHDKAYGQNWNIPGSGTISGEEIIQIAKGYTKNEKKVQTVSKLMISCLGLVDRQMREYVEMYYLNETPVILNGEKYESEIGPLPKTPYTIGIEKTLHSMIESMTVAMSDD